MAHSMERDPKLKKKLLTSAMKTSIYYFCIAYLICSKTNLRVK